MLDIVILWRLRISWYNILASLSLTILQHKIKYVNLESVWDTNKAITRLYLRTFIVHLSLAYLSSKTAACNCDPMGSVSMQCHANGTCLCRQGFVGYKCDKCELNHYQNPLTHQCEECPVCYSLIRDQVCVFLILQQIQIATTKNKLLWKMHAILFKIR